MPPPRAPTRCWRPRSGKSWRRSLFRWRSAAFGRARPRAAPTSALRQVVERIHRLAVVADLEMQHVARGPAVAELGDLLSRLHRVALLHEPRAVVPIGAQPVLVVLDDDQLAVAD